MIYEGSDQQRYYNMFLTYEPRCNKLYGDQYTYDEFVYTSSREKSTATCKDHGNFEVSMNNHLKGHRCPQCAFEQSGNANVAKHKQSFVQRAREVHGNRYDYSKAKYTKVLEPLIIVCKKHGEFNQTPNNHINHKNGCRLCGMEKLLMSNIKDKTSKFHVYYIKVHGKYKIGITHHNSIAKRFSKDGEIEVLEFTEPMQLTDALNLEQAVIKKYKKHLTKVRVMYERGCDGEVFDVNIMKDKNIKESIA